jgi:hypothetical protein
VSLGQRVQVSAKYTRSTNLERDRGSLEVIRAYVPTSRGVKLLNSVAAGLSTDDCPRAWSLIGPYGSGKSSFALFLSELLSGKQSNTQRAAAKVLRTENAAMMKAFTAQPAWLRVTLTGSAEPLAQRLLLAIENAADHHWRARKGRKPQVLRELKQAAQLGSVPTSTVLALVSKLQEALERSDGGGLLIVIDELGKFLEYEARHYGANDIFLLQGLAELAFTGRKANLLLFVLLHQSFDLYARGLGESLKNDWAKVQGRFQNVPFVETTEQVLRVVERAFTQSMSAQEQRVVRRDAERIADKLASANALPGILDAKQAAVLFSACYPIHPVALLALPLLCQKFAQNERTLFSYLGSQEPHGLQHALERITKVGDWVHPSSVFDYFIQNQPAVLADPLTHRRWAEVVTAVERAERLAIDAQELAKTIGLLNLISGGEGLRASQLVLSSMYRNDRTCVAAIRSLTDASIVQFRKFSSEYRVWQGTDFDLEEHVVAETQKLGKFDLAPILTERAPIEPIMARRHSIQCGAVRYFDVRFHDARSTSRYVANDSTPQVVIYLAEGQDDEELFNTRLLANIGDADVAALYRNGAEIRAAISEVLALEAVQRGAQELASDPIAARELKERLAAAKLQEQVVLRALIDQPSRSEWFFRGKALAISHQRSLQCTLSSAMDEIYASTPLIHNELINRDRLSSQAAAARNKLMQAMLDRPQVPGLEIQKYPPEKAIYRSIFERGRLHTIVDGSWGFVAPGGDCALALASVWNALDQFFEATEAGRRTVAELQELLHRPPFGLKHGVFPVILLHYYLVNGHELALYEDDLYVPSLSFEHIERLLRRPEAFSFQRFRIEGVRASLFAHYKKALFGDADRKSDIIGIARPLSNFMLGLEDYTKKTRSLSRRTLAIRDAFFLSKSPEKLLLTELPKACGFDEVKEDDAFADVLLSSLRELKGAYEELLSGMTEALGEAFGVNRNTPLDELRGVLRGRCYGLDDYTVDVKGLKSFIRRVCDKDPDDQGWLTGLLLFLAHKPSSKWSDQDRDAAAYRLNEFSRRLLDLEKLRLHYDAAAHKALDLDIIMIKALRKGHPEVDDIVAITDRTLAATKHAKAKILETLEELNDKDLQLALVAEITHYVLKEQRESQRDQQRDVKEEGPSLYVHQ